MNAFLANFASFNIRLVTFDDGTRKRNSDKNEQKQKLQHTESATKKVFSVISNFQRNSAFCFAILTNVNYTSAPSKSAQYTKKNKKKKTNALFRVVYFFCVTAQKLQSWTMSPFIK